MTERRKNKERKSLNNTNEIIYTVCLHLLNFKSSIQNSNINGRVLIVNQLNKVSIQCSM